MYYIWERKEKRRKKYIEGRIGGDKKKKFTSVVD
jgi:hypothetical protein